LNRSDLSYVYWLFALSIEQSYLRRISKNSTKKKTQLLHKIFYKQFHRSYRNYYYLTDANIPPNQQVAVASQWKELLAEKRKEQSPKKR